MNIDLKNRLYVVYFHLNPKTNEVFYVGMGNDKRPYDFSSRHTDWYEYAFSNGKPLVKIVHNKLTKKQADILEKKYILNFGHISNGGKLINIKSVPIIISANINYSKLCENYNIFRKGVEVYRVFPNGNYRAINVHNQRGRKYIIFGGKQINIKQINEKPLVETKGVTKTNCL